MLRLLLTLSLLMKQSERTCSVLKRSAGLLAWLAIPLNGYSPFFCPIFSKVNGYAPFFNRVLWIFLAFLTLFIPFFWVGMLRFIQSQPLFVSILLLSLQKTQLDLSSCLICCCTSIILYF